MIVFIHLVFYVWEASQKYWKKEETFYPNFHTTELKSDLT